MNEIIKILHLEDMPSDAELAARELKKFNISFDHLVISSENEYIKALDNFRPDLILCDHSLPSFNSLEALRLVKRKGLKIPFILITATMSEEIASEVIREGADDYILKDRIKRLPYAVLNARGKYKYEQERRELLDEVHIRETQAKKAFSNIATKLAMATKVSGVGVWEYLIAEDKGIWDEQMFSLYGFSQTPEISWNQWMNSVHPDDYEGLQEDFSFLIESKQSTTAEYRIRHNDGSWRIISSHAVVERDPEGKAIRMVGTNQDVSAERQAAARLRESEARFRSFFENSLDGIFLTEPDGAVLQANPAGCELFGMTEQEIQQAGRLGVVDTSDPVVAKHIEQRQRTGKAFNVMTLIRKDGSTFPGEVSSKTFVDAYGEYRTTIMVRDISARKKAEEELSRITNDLRQTVKTLNNIMESSLDIICTIDKEGKLVTVSSAAQQIWGYKKEELEGKPYIDLVYEDDREKTILAAAGIMRGIPVRMFENRNIRRDEKVVPLLWSAKWNEDDQLLYCIAKDATEKNRLEKAFEIERQRFLGLYFQAPSCMGILKGPDHVFELANPLYLELIGKKDIIGKPAKEVLPELLDQGFLEIVDRVYNTGEPFKGEEVLVGLDTSGTGQLQTKYLNLLYQANRNSEGEIDGILFFANDVTEQVLSREKVEEAFKELALSNKELEQFAYGASHDLQEPLRMVTNFLTQIERKYSEVLDEKGKKYIHFAVDGAKRMRQIILDLLQFSRVGRIAEKLEPVDLNVVVREVLYTFKRQVKDARIEIKPGPLPVISTYKTLILLVFQNLIGNALKYSQKNVSTVIEISFSETGEFWQFEIKDNGIGIEEEYLEQIFIVFQRLHNKDEYSGTGMGLAICKRIIENINGSIWARSEPGKGSSFFFTIPKLHK